MQTASCLLTTPSAIPLALLAYTCHKPAFKSA